MFYLYSSNVFSPEALVFQVQSDSSGNAELTLFDGGFFLATQTEHNLHLVKNCNIPASGFVRN